jgi:hypothetical protein
MIFQKDKIINTLDFRGTKMQFLENLSARDLFTIIADVLQLVSRKETFKARDLAPKKWEGTIYQPLFIACGESKTEANRLFGVIVKQALIMTPLLFKQDSADTDFDAVTYTRA